jgi:hypothetical protein
MSDTLFLVIDYSSTGPKFFYGKSWTDLLPMLFAPQVVEINETLPIDLPDHSVIKLNGQTYLTGQAAKNYLNGAIYLKQPKIDKAIPQTLSAIVYATKKLELTGRIDLELKCLLPAGEIKNHRSVLEAEITEAAKNFGTLTKQYKAKVRSFQCKPEGVGLLVKFSELCGLPLEDLSVLVISLGYRNNGSFSLVDGTIGNYRSPRLGFNTLVEIFRPMIGGLDGEDITEGLSKYLETGDKSRLRYIAKFGGDIDSIATAADEARNIYCTKLKQDFDEYLPEADSVIVGGGSVQVLQHHLYDCLGRDKISFHAGLGKAWNYPDELKGQLKDDLYYRFADLYCFC